VLPCLLLYNCPFSCLAFSLVSHLASYLASCLASYLASHLASRPIWLALILTCPTRSCSGPACPSSPWWSNSPGTALSLCLYVHLPVSPLSFSSMFSTLFTTMSVTNMLNTLLTPTQC
jgi:hypothetical protein